MALGGAMLTGWVCDDSDIMGISYGPVARLPSRLVDGDPQRARAWFDSRVLLGDLGGRVHLLGDGLPVDSGRVLTVLPSDLAPVGHHNFVVTKKLAQSVLGALLQIRSVFLSLGSLDLFAGELLNLWSVRERLAGHCARVALNDPVRVARFGGGHAARDDIVAMP